MAQAHGQRATSGHRKIRSKIDDESLKSMWATEMTVMEMCAALGALQHDVMRRARLLGLPRRSRGGTYERAADPSREEIERMCEEIQARHWTEEERSVRWQGNGTCHWTLPVVSVEESQT